MARGPSPCLFPYKNNSEIYIPRDFAERPLCFSIINPQSVISQKGPWKLKINSRKALSLKQIHKMAQNFKIPYLLTTTPNLVTLTTKFSGSLLLSFYAFI
jgi:hypothetical protein